MKLALKSLALACSLFMAGTVHAEVVKGTIIGGTPPIEIMPGWHFSGLDGSATLTFSNVLVSAMNAGGIESIPIAPAAFPVHTQIVRPQNSHGIAVTAPVVALTGLFDGSTLEVTRLTSRGGIQLLAVNDGITNSGGALAITNISIDLGEKTIYADIDGANGVGYHEQIALWSFDTLTGPSRFAAAEGPIASTNTASGLTITDTAFASFSQSLGLTEDGVSAMSRVTDYGTMAVTFGLIATYREPALPVVPEPSTYMLMGLGLMGLAFASKRARRA